MAVVTVHATRAELSLADLSLTTDPYQTDVDGLDPGDSSWRRIVASPPFVHGDIEVHKVEAQSRGRLEIEVKSASAAQLKTDLQTLRAALRQTSWELHVLVDGVEFAWRCDAADFTVRWAGANWWALQVPVIAVFPRYPIALVGGI